MQTVSEIQKQFYVNSRLFSDSSAYTISAFIRIEGNLNEAGLESAWKRILDAAPILRSRIEEASGSISAGASAADSWQRIACDEATAIKTAEAEAAAPVPLDSCSLARLTLFSVEAKLHYVLIIQHHIATDLHSKRLLASALGKAYADASYRPAFAPYSRFVQAEADYLGSSAAETAQSYWAEKLRPFAEALKLPHSTYAPKAFSGEGRSLPWKMPADIARVLPEAERDGKSPFLVMLAAYACLLYRMSGKGRFLIGVPLTNRGGLEDLAIIGPCVNILPVALDLGPESSFDDAYAQVRREMLLNARHQAYPFIRLAALSQAKRDPLRPYLLQAGFTREEPMKLELSGLSCRTIELKRSGAQMDLFFTWWETEQGYEGRWVYNSGSYSDAETSAWMEYYGRLLRAALCEPESAISRTALLDSARIDFLTGADSSADYPLEKNMSLLLRESMALHPDALALRYRGMSVSYAEFSDRVASVASLLHRSYGEGGRIAVLLERSPEMLYSLHGILHSGNAYVPMGIDWPTERIQTILEDIEPAAIITQESQKHRLADAKAPVHTVESFASGYGRGTAFPEARIAPSDSMYILFTSGTTGKPKGADLPHRGLVNRLAWMREQFKLQPGGKVLLNTPYTFDIAGWQIFMPFLAGAAVAVCEEGQHRDPRAMLRLIDSESVSLATFVPSMLAHFLPVVPKGGAKSLRALICAGEALSVELAARFFETLPDAGLHNTYGPTEASIDVSYWAVSRADIERGTVPIGRPLPNCQTYVLDTTTLAICPPLVEGELYLGGVQLAKSYWKREEITAKAFIASPFGPGRLYKTGDACRYGLDGAIEYLGRLDDQLKIRGIRVETGEIETRVKAIAGVKNAALKKGATPSGEECLIVYYASDADIDPSVFRAELGKHILSSIIPEYYLRLDALPLSENGKLNRKALSAIAPDMRKATTSEGGHAGGEFAEGGEFAAGGDAVEAAVEDAWKKILRAASIPHDQNFFDAGGHSLSLLDLRALLEKEFKIEIPIAELFARPSIADMAGLFRAGNDKADGTIRARAERARASMAVRRPPEREKSGNS